MHATALVQPLAAGSIVICTGRYLRHQGRKSFFEGVLSDKPGGAIYAKATGIFLATEQAAQL